MKFKMGYINKIICYGYKKKKKYKHRLFFLPGK